MSDMQLKGSSGFLGKETPINVRRVNDGITTEQVKAAIQDNNLDEIVVKGKSGSSYVVYADELSVAKGSLPKPGTKVTIPFLPGDDGKQPATVQLVDDEFNEDYNFLSGGLVGTLLNSKGGNSGDDSQIRAVSQATRPGELPDISQKKLTSKEMNWAKDLEDIVNNGSHSPTAVEKDTYDKIYSKYLATQPPLPKFDDSKYAIEPYPQSVNDPFRGTQSTPTSQEKEWVIALEKAVKTEKYTPNHQELVAYFKIIQKMSDTPDMSFDSPQFNQTMLNKIHSGLITNNYK